MDALDLQRYGNILDKMPQEGLAIIESKSKVRYSRSRANDSRVSTDAPLSNSSSSNNSFDMQQIAASLEDKMTIKMNQMMNQMKALVVTPAPVKAVEETISNNFNKPQLLGKFPPTGKPLSHLASQMRPPGFNQPNVQNNQNRYQGTNSNFNQNRGGNFNQNRQNNQNQVFQPPTYQTPMPQIQGVAKTDFENYVKANDAVLKNVQNQGQNLQNQMANVTSLLTSLCDNFKNSASTSNPGTLPSQTVTNPRQQINAITTRSGKNLERPSTPLVPTPDFNKWLSSLLRNKEKLEEIAIMTVNAECSAIIMNKVPEKLEDPGKFLIPCALQELNRTSALADSGASINLSPHSIFKKLGLEALTPTRMTLELANRSITHPMGIAEDVVVRVDGFTFLADFVVVNFEPDPRVPIILGRPFLRTAKALIDLYEETLTLRVGKDELVYYADKSEKNKNKHCVHAISVIDFSKDDPF
ncbi:reverse transcriptase domain-containing protein [Tanacetum coccineum]